MMYLMYIYIQVLEYGQNMLAPRRECTIWYKYDKNIVYPGEVENIPYCNHI